MKDLLDKIGKPSARVKRVMDNGDLHDIDRPDGLISQAGLRDLYDITHSRIRTFMRRSDVKPVRYVNPPAGGRKVPLFDRAAATMVIEAKLS